MPNWCFTNITICHNDKDQLIDFFNNVKTWLKKQYKPNSYDKYSEGWLGNLVGNANLSSWDEKKDDFLANINCRGYVTSLELTSGSIQINTETAWAPIMRVWHLLCDKYLPDASIWFTAEEPGNCIYESNDPDVYCKYYIDIQEPPEEFENEESIYEAKEAVVVDFLQRVLKTEESDIDVLLNMANEMEDRWFSINMWVECDISDCE